MLTNVNICLIAFCMNLAIGSIIDDIYDVFYTYSIKSSTTRRMTGRLAIATLCLNVSSTAFLWVIGQKVLLLMPMELVKY